MLSLTKRDFEVETFRAGGKGGQNQNKRDTGVRIRHLASGAVAESREFRTQLENKKAAFDKLIKSDKLRAWIKTEVARRAGAQVRAKEEVKRQTSLKDILVEVKENGRWRPE